MPKCKKKGREAISWRRERVHLMERNGTSQKPAVKYSDSHEQKSHPRKSVYAGRKAQVWRNPLRYLQKTGWTWLYQWLRPTGKPQVADDQGPANKVRLNMVEHG